MLSVIHALTGLIYCDDLCFDACFGATLATFRWCGLHCHYFGNTPVYKCFDVDLGT